MTTQEGKPRYLEEITKKIKFDLFPNKLGLPAGLFPEPATASEITGKADTVEALRGVAAKVDEITRDVAGAVAIHELASNIAAEREAVAKVTIPGWSPFYKTSGGDWHGEGGSYGPETELGKKLEAALKEQQSPDK